MVVGNAISSNFVCDCLQKKKHLPGISGVSSNFQLSIGTTHFSFTYYQLALARHARISE